MKFTINGKDLKVALSRIISISEKKASNGQVNECLFKVKKSKIEILSTDNEIFAKVTANGFSESEFEFKTNSKSLFDITKELTDEKICFEFSSQDNLLKLSTENSFYQLLTYENENFSFCPFPENSTPISLSKFSLLQMLALTSYAVSNDETRIYLNGVFLQEVNESLRMVATDGHRLSMLETDFVGTGNDYLLNGVILPKKGIQELKRICESKSVDNLDLYIDDTFIYIKNNEDYELSIRQISRDYPKYQAVIPNKTKTNFCVEKNIFFDAVKRIKVISNEKSNQIRLKVSSGKAELSANHPSLGKAKEIVPIKYDGDTLEIGFNAKYLVDALGVMSSDEIYFELNNEISPIVLKTPNQPNYLGIIMPLKL
tara:strand:- start:911 stop:2026 length:1116 start_codon:yes stop_codon:yes gene_type:complete